MKVVGFNGSPRKNGNTQVLIKKVFAELESQDIETELVQVGGKTIKPCRACYKCFKNQDKKCSVDDDILNDCISKMLDADGIILGSPVYFSNITPEIKSLMDRSGLVGTANGGLYKRKVGASVVAVRRAGAVTAFDALNHFLLYGQMVVPGSCYWNVSIGRDPGEVEKDEEGMKIMKVLGENMAWLMHRISAPQNGTA